MTFPHKTKVIFYLLFVLIIHQVSAQGTNTILIKNVRIFDGKSNALSMPSNVLIEGGKIKSIQTGDVSGSDGLIIEGGGKTLMPGLIDVHVHMAFGALTMREMMSPMMSEGVIVEKLEVTPRGCSCVDLLLSGMRVVLFFL
jgi:adenine deaminase